MRATPPIVPVLTAALYACAASCAPPPPPCDPVAVLATAPDAIEMVEGGRGFLVVPHDTDVVVRVEGLIAGFTSHQRADGVLVVTGPYGVSGTLPARLDATCSGGETVAKQLQLAITPLRVERLAPLSPPFAGSGAADALDPGARRTPGLAAVAAGVVVVGGSTLEGRPLDDAWLQPRAQPGEVGAWRKLDVALAPLVGAGSLRATAIDDARILVLGPRGAVALVDVDRETATVLTPGGSAPEESDGAALVRVTSSLPTPEAAKDNTTTLALCGRTPASRIGGVESAQRHCDVRAFDAATRDDDPLRPMTPWRAVTPTGFAPAGRDGAIVAVDLETRRLVLFGGQRDEGPAADAWTLALDDIEESKVSWVRLTSALDGDVEPTPRRGACGALDPVGHRLVVAGGIHGEGPSRGVVMFDLEPAPPSEEDVAPGDVREPRRPWREVAVDGMPDGNDGCSAAWDPYADRIVVGFGAPFGDAANAPSSLWALRLAPDPSSDE